MNHTLSIEPGRYETLCIRLAKCLGLVFNVEFVRNSGNLSYDEWRAKFNYRHDDVVAHNKWLIEELHGKYGSMSDADEKVGFMTSWLTANYGETREDACSAFLVKYQYLMCAMDNRDRDDYRYSIQWDANDAVQFLEKKFIDKRVVFTSIEELDMKLAVKGF